MSETVSLILVIGGIVLTAVILFGSMKLLDWVEREYEQVYGWIFTTAALSFFGTLIAETFFGLMLGTWFWLVAGPFIILPTAHGAFWTSFRKPREDEVCPKCGRPPETSEAD